MPRRRISLLQIFWAFVACWVITLAGFGVIVWVVHDVGTQRCEDRQEGREGVRELVLFVTGPEGKPDESPRLTELRNLVLPGGKLEPIHCS